MVTAYIGLGANVGDPARQLRVGVDALGALPRTRVVICSSLYRSAPVGVAAQPDFVNAVCAVETELPANDLMRALLKIEREHGRTRSGERGEPRVMDLDLLLYGLESIATAELVLPHPRMHERAFVMMPLAEIAPGVVIPGRGPVTQLLRACADQRVERIESW